MFISIRRALVLVLSLAAAFPGVSMADSFTSLTIFGDSLSDTGNLHVATGGSQPGSPYWDGRFSNGPVWVEHLALDLGLEAHVAPSLVGGNNYSFGGARTGSGTPPGLVTQTGMWAPGNPVADATGLYVLIGGSNDMRDARSLFGSDSVADQTGRQAAADAAIRNLSDSVTLLAVHGVRNLLVTNVIDLGMTPEATFIGANAASTDATNRFNAQLGGVVALGASLGINMFMLDLDGLMKDIVNDALSNGGAVYGIQNVVTPCGTFTGSVGISCATSLFSDGWHPSAAAHSLIGARALDLVQAEAEIVSEPATVALLPLALTALVLARNRSLFRRRAERPQ